MTIDARWTPASRSRRCELAARAPRDRARRRGFVHRGRQLVDARARRRARTASTTAGCGCRSSAGSLGVARAAPSRRRGDRPRRRPLERPGARLPRATCARAGRRACSSSSASRRRAARARARSPARCSSASSANALNQLDTRPGRALKAYLLAGALAARRAASRSPSCSLPTISARWRCSETQDRTRSAPC